MHETLEQKNLYGQSIIQNPLFLHLLTNFYKRFVYQIPQRLLHIPKVSDTIAIKIYDALIQTQALAAHEAYFTQCFGIDTTKDEDFTTHPSRIALLPRTQLYTLVLIAGMTLCREHIVKTVSRQEVEKIRNLQNIIPEKNMSPHAFAVQKAHMYKGHSDVVLRAAAKESYTQQFAQLPLDTQIIAWGLWSVLSCVQLGGQSLVLRTLVTLDPFCERVPNIAEFSQHLPESQQNTQPRLQHTYATEALAWPLIRVLLCKEIICPWEDGWTTLFA